MTQNTRRIWCSKCASVVCENRSTTNFESTYHLHSHKMHCHSITKSNRPNKMRRCSCAQQSNVANNSGWRMTSEHPFGIGCNLARFPFSTCHCLPSTRFPSSVHYVHCLLLIDASTRNSGCCRDLWRVVNSPPPPSYAG